VHSQTATRPSLLIRLGDGPDASAWDVFEARYARLVRAVARRRGLQPADCDDVAQEVLLSLSKAMPGFRYDPAKGKFRAYLKTATLRAVLRKSRQNHAEMALGTGGDEICDAAADAELQAAWDLEWQRYHLRQAMRKLRTEFRPVHWQAFQRYAVDGCDPRATARDLGLSVNQVYKIKSRILRRLEDVIARQIDEEG